ncbi:hypothetical protein HPP92_005958 [Vanilla planifolia]|uniref:MORF/ORRM1/DAG-like MORF domain-containing protein n=1 Tax=Vanilla planifolia TaxID=51239 RepID=A0A835RHS7_VANPL|nr:hypothetical protein HPP92_005958 [Vanilla planifolia]
MRRMEETWRRRFWLGQKQISRPSIPSILAVSEGHEQNDRDTKEAPTSSVAHSKGLQDEVGEAFAGKLQPKAVVRGIFEAGGWQQRSTENVRDAQMCIYDASWESDFGFCCDIDDKSSRELAHVPGVLSVSPDLRICTRCTLNERPLISELDLSTRITKVGSKSSKRGSLRAALELIEV